MRCCTSPLDIPLLFPFLSYAPILPGCHCIIFTLYYLTCRVLQAQSILGWSPIEFDATLETRIMPVFEGNWEPTAFWSVLRLIFLSYSLSMRTPTHPRCITPHYVISHHMTSHCITSRTSMLSLIVRSLRCSLCMMISPFSNHDYT